MRGGPSSPAALGMARGVGRLRRFRSGWREGWPAFARCAHDTRDRLPHSLRPGRQWGRRLGRAPGGGNGDRRPAERFYGTMSSRAERPEGAESRDPPHAEWRGPRAAMPPRARVEGKREAAPSDTRQPPGQTVPLTTVRSIRLCLWRQRVGQTVSLTTVHRSNCASDDRETLKRAPSCRRRHSLIGRLSSEAQSVPQRWRLRTVFGLLGRTRWV